MAEHSIILRKTEEARLDQLYRTKCDEVLLPPILFNCLHLLGLTDEHHLVLSVGD